MGHLKYDVITKERQSRRTRTIKLDTSSTHAAAQDGEWCTLSNSTASVAFFSLNAQIDFFKRKWLIININYVLTPLIERGGPYLQCPPVCRPRTLCLEGHKRVLDIACCRRY